MKIKIKQYKHQKIEIDSKDFELPEENSYFFETGIRRSIRISPEYTTWNLQQYNKPEEIYQFNITCVYLNFECKIERFSVRISDFENPTHKNKSFIDSWTSDYFDTRTQEQFENDLKQAINIITENE